MDAVIRVLWDSAAGEVYAGDLACVLGRKGWSKATRAARQAAVKSFFGWLAEQGYTTANPAATLGSVRMEEWLPRPIPRADLEAILKEANRLPLAPRCLFHLLADIGCRVGEVLALNVEDVVWDKGQEAVVIRRGKGGRGRVVPILSGMTCYPLLKRLCRLQGQGAVFTTNRGTRADYDWAYYWWNQALEKAGLAEKGYTIHQLRHTRITEWVRSGMELLAVRRAAGHRDIRMTERYAEVNDQDVRREMERCREG